jgi:YidC/Oxa1 family membrane protein insertase
MSVPLLDTAVAAVYPLVTNLATTLHPVGGASTAIVVCTAVLRLMLLPLTRAAVRGERSRAALAPRVRELQRRFRQDPARLRAELARLYQGAGVSPLAGFLPLLLQAPALMVCYRLFSATRIAGQPNDLLAQRFLGAALSTRLLGDGHPLAFLPLLLALGLLAVLALRRARQVAAATDAPAPRGALALLPFASPVSAVLMPLAAVLYLVATLTWTAAENILLRRGLPPR